MRVQGLDIFNLESQRLQKNVPAAPRHNTQAATAPVALVAAGAPAEGTNQSMNHTGCSEVYYNLKILDFEKIYSSQSYN